jgi:ATP-dependent Lhr-like helicase
VSAFGRLHTSVQHHVVNTLGWPSLRPHQEQAIAPILDGCHVLVQAPTAGGKTEAAMLPLLSRMLSEGWGAPGVLYLCPIKALLNDLEPRLQRLTGLFGRRTGVWHGDIGTSVRRRLTRDAPDVLLATPESVEVMLVSRLVDHRAFFAGLRAVVVDEIHALAGDDRGWHLLALLERVQRLAGRPVQRIGLSATLANAPGLLDWLTAGREEPKHVVAGVAAGVAEVDVQVDYVGKLSNAALVVSRLHAGEKRLVFCDSRGQVEALASELRLLGVRTYASHSSLSRDQRLEAEAAFAQGTDCVIVATGTLELGIDVGDLDRVIQVDAPHSVASFLQRIGRSGRRAGSTRNCVFLATGDEALLRALAIVHLWARGYVEPVEPPPAPYHVLAQQVLARVLQEDGAPRSDLAGELARFCRTAGIASAELDDVIGYMLEQGILFEDGGILGLGEEGRTLYGARNYLELFSVFLSPPLFTVFHGNAELGQVHELTFRGRAQGPVHLSLGGRTWRVRHVDWSARRAYVEPGDLPGSSRWLGSGQPMRFELAQAVRHVLLHGVEDRFLSRRAGAKLGELQEEHAWLSPTGTTLQLGDAEGHSRWWTFAGERYNAAAATELTRRGFPAAVDALAVSIRSDAAALPEAVAAAGRAVAHEPQPDSAVADPLPLKFIECVPAALRAAMHARRNAPAGEARRVGAAPLSTRVLR